MGFSKFFLGAGATGASKVMDSAGKLGKSIRTAITGVDPDVANAIEASVAAHQQELNKLEARSPRLFIAGWRPAIGWVCVAGLAMIFIVNPLLLWVSTWLSLNIPLIEVDTGGIMALVTTMLGMGGMRSFEKIRKSEDNR